ncbi:unnamed protein product [Cunninghamella blakesleeana]
MTIEKPELDPTTFDYNDWMTNDFSIDSTSSVTPATVNMTKSSSMKPQLIQWSPVEGNENTTISIILETNQHNIQGSLKIVFGQLAVDTTSQIHSMPTLEQESNTWITLVAKVPKLQDVQTASDCQIPVSICHFSVNNPDVAIDTWTIGAFTYLDQVLQYCKRAASPNLSDDFPQKRLYSSLSTTDDTSVDSQFLQLLAPYEDPLSKELSSQPNQQDQNTALWLSQQLQQQQRRLFIPAKQDILPESKNHSHFFNHTTGLNGNFSLPSEYNIITSNKHNLQQNGLAYVDYSNINMAPQKFTAPHLSYPFGNRCNYNVSLPYHASNQQNQLMAQKSSFNNLYYTVNNASLISRKNVYNHNSINNRQHNSNNNNNNNNNNNSNNNNRYSHPHINNMITTVHPFAGVLNKANLKICGDLMEMTFQWSASEWQSGRRLVRFWRRQNTNNVENSQQVECGFEPIEYFVHQQQMQQQQQQRRLQFSSSTTSLSSSSSSSSLPSSSPSDIGSNSSNNNNTIVTEVNENGIKTSSLIVSCIYWRERNDYFITSVDCIYLLEGLIGVQFTVEEKNRIRRNLEGFRPLTVSKCKIDCADFFKLIMGFPHPKPRNIEKDVKVFSWKTLPHALRKIIRKYTPNYTNTTTQSSSSSSASNSSSNSMNHISNELSSSSSSSSSPLSIPTPTTASSVNLNASSTLPLNSNNNDVSGNNSNSSSNMQQSQNYQQYYF